MVDAQLEAVPELKRAVQKVGFVIAIAINLAMVVIVHNILEWGWLPFLTPDFAQVLPWITFSLIATIVANTIYLLGLRPTAKPIWQIGLNLISLAVTYRLWQVFPFDFSGSDFDWTFVARVVLVLAMVGSGVGALTEVSRLFKTSISKEGGSW